MAGGAEVDEGIDKVGTKLGGAAIGIDRGVELPLAAQGVSKIEVGLGKVAAEFERFLGGGDGFFETSGVGEGGAEAAMGIGHFWVELGRALQRGDGEFAIALAAVCFTKVEVKAGKIGHDGDGPLDEIGSFVKAAGLGGEQAHEMQDVGFAGILGKKLPIKDLCLIQSAGLMMADRQFQGLLGGHDWIIAQGIPLTTWAYVQYRSAR